MAQFVAQAQASGGIAAIDRKFRGTDERRRSQGGAPAPPSPALVRNGSKQRRLPATLTPGGGMSGQATPHSAAAQVNIPVGARRLPNATFDENGFNENGLQHQQSYEHYGATSPMVSTSAGVAPPAVSNVRAQAGGDGVAHDYQGQQIDDDAPPKNSLLRILTCRCG